MLSDAVVLAELTVLPLRPRCFRSSRASAASVNPFDTASRSSSRGSFNADAAVPTSVGATVGSIAKSSSSLPWSCCGAGGADTADGDPSAAATDAIVAARGTLEVAYFGDLGTPRTSLLHEEHEAGDVAKEQRQRYQTAVYAAFYLQVSSPTHHVV